MKAYEMFEKLELNLSDCLLDRSKYIRYEHKVEEHNCTYVVLFDKCNKRFSVYYENLENSEKYFPPVDMEILKAIIQQCKELGWFYE